MTTTLIEKIDNIDKIYTTCEEVEQNANLEEYLRIEQEREKQRKMKTKNNTKHKIYDKKYITAVQLINKGLQVLYT